MKNCTRVNGWMHAAQPKCTANRDGRTRGCGGIFPVLLLAALVLAGCGGQIAPPEFCAERRISLAMDMFDRAKEHLAIHYKQRTDSNLGVAYRASQDAVTLARASRRCRDFDLVIRRQAIDLIRTNQLFQKLVVSNMRDQDPGVVIDIYGPQYREIFKNDIQ